MFSRLLACHVPRIAISRFPSRSTSSAISGAPRIVSNFRSFVTNTSEEHTPGTKAFGGSDKIKCVIHDLFMSYARPRNVTAGDDTPCLRVEDLRDLLVSLGEKPSDLTLSHLIEEVDADNNGTIELDEFLVGCDTILGSGAASENENIDIVELIETFKTIDRDGNGVLTLDELDGLLSAAGGHIGFPCAAEILELADTDRNGTIDLPEFIDFVTDKKHNHFSWRLRSAFRVLLVIGGPGSGKGVLCERLTDAAGIKHFSSGEMLREEVSSGSALGKSIEGIIKDGQLVPSSTMIALIKKQIGKFPGALLALDGFPRSVENYEDFDEICGPPEFAIHIDVPDDVMIERIIGRAKSGGGRSDDNVETAKSRIETFHNLTTPTFDCLHGSGIPVLRLDGTRTPDDVWQQLLDVCPSIRRRTEDFRD